MSKWTELARGEQCYIRLPGICGNPETVVFAHIRMIGVSGAGLKSPDVLGCPACQHCHDAADRRAHMDLDRDYVRLAHLEGVMRWQYRLIRDGVIRL